MRQTKGPSNWHLLFSFLFCLVITGCGSGGGGGIPPVPAPTNDVNTTGDLIIGDDDPFEVVYVGPQTRHFHTGNVYIINSGTLRVDGGEFHLKGEDTNIWVTDQGRMLFENGAFLHYEQSYIAQHNIIGSGSGSVELYDTRVDCDGSIDFVHMTENASFTAKDTTYDDWTTWYLYDQSSLILERVMYAGDIVFYDSPTIRIKDTFTVMPWLYFPAGSVVDTDFPAPSLSLPVSKTINNGQPGFSGIPWSFEVENCLNVAWGIHPCAGSNVTIRDTLPLTMVLFPFMGSGTFAVQDVFQNATYYADETIPVSDRTLRLVNTRVTWWKVDAKESATVTADNIIFSEMMVHDSAAVFATNSICEGQTVHLGVKDDGFVHFREGEVWSYVSAWQNATMVLENTKVDWTLGDYIYQKHNIAHGGSRLYCLNTDFNEYYPEAVDAALAMYERIDSPTTGETVGKGVIPIYGSAWTANGPLSPHSFKLYSLAWAPAGGSDWTPIEISDTPVEWGILGWWNTSFLSSGMYQLKLTILVNGVQSSHPTNQFPLIIKDIGVK
jgi:hypothetical protein